MPNDELSLYGDEGDFRLRVLTSGGFSPDGVTGLRPEMFEDFFRVHARGADGEMVVMDEVGVDYEVAGGTLIGLADLGQAEDRQAGIYFDDCYAEDRDNQIDIILAGDESAAPSIESVEIPSLRVANSALLRPRAGAVRRMAPRKGRSRRQVRGLLPGVGGQDGQRRHLGGVAARRRRAGRGGCPRRHRRRPRAVRPPGLQLRRPLGR